MFAFAYVFTHLLERQGEKESGANPVAQQANPVPYDSHTLQGHWFVSQVPHFQFSSLFITWKTSLLSVNMPSRN